MSDSPPETPSRTRRIARRLLATYVVVTSAFVFLTLVDGESLWPLELLDAGTHGLLAPAPVIALWAAARRRWRVTAAMGVVTLYLAFACGGWLLPDPSGPDDDRSELRVLTWNLGLGICDVDRVAAEVRAADPDVVMFQALFERLGEDLPHYEHFQDDRFSKAYLSRLEPTAVRFERPENGKNFVEIQVPVEGRSVSITSFHSNKAFAVFGREWYGIDSLMDQVRYTAARPHSLLVGDFNMTERNAVYADVRDTGLIDSYRELHNGPGFTFPAFGRYRKLPLPPLVRIDYLWHTPDMRCLHIARTDPADSDHRGVVGTFVFD